MLHIAIIGASGFIGSNLIQHLSDTYRIKAVSRSEKMFEHENVTWEKLDLFSLKSTIKTLEDVDIAIYLVHSMSSTTSLLQGSFHDVDLVLADNFAHACKVNHVKQIIYLGGIIPKDYISPHLESRKEVENVLKSTHIPCTILRSGLVVGNGGSSFEILKNLVLTLPAMLLPKWTQSRTQIIYIYDLLKIFEIILNNESFFDEILNITNGQNLHYQNLIEETIKYFNRKRLLIPVPIYSTKFSKLWVTVFGRAEYKLVSPLIDSLLCDFSEVFPDQKIEHVIQYKTFKSMLPEIKSKKSKKKTKKKKIFINNIKSIQRLTGETELNVEHVATLYIEWLSKYLHPFVQIRKHQNYISFHLFKFNTAFLILEKEENINISNCFKFNIIGGVLSKTNNTGWLEFRKVLKDQILLTSIHKFEPSLPIFIYKYTQAIIHKHIMKKFGNYLTKQSKNNTF